MDNLIDHVRINSSVRLDAYRIIADAVEQGIQWGLQHARKHIDGDPGDDVLAECLERDIMNELCEILEFD